METALGRTKFAKGFALGDADRLQNLDIPTRLGQHFDADLVDCVNKRRRAAVHDRHFGAIDFNQGIVDAEPAQGGENMFGGRAKDARFVAQNGGEFRRSHSTVISADFALPTVRIGPRKHDAGVGIGGIESKVNGQPGMNPNSGNCYLFT